MKPFLLFFLLIVCSAFPQTPSPSEIIIKLSPSSALLKRDAKPHEILSDELQAVLAQAGKHQVTRALPESFPNEEGQFLLLRYHAPSAALAELITQLARFAEIEYAQFNHVYRCEAPPTIPPLRGVSSGVDQSQSDTPIAPLKGGMSSQDIPNDSLFSKQWALATLRATDAWQITTGSREVLVAVIDTGVELDHPDLQPNLWINAAEDLNHNQQRDEGDFNNIDDDNNGFIDDVIGWDFTDAPNLPDGDDYLERDNDPSDRFGHGTAVAGVIGAAANNRIGIAGLAPNCRVMALRAGNARGFLEEDDVASALVYAVMNGARVINMSFGDLVTSPMLRDVIRFAHRRGAVLVAASGNAGTEELYYPASFSETISVGASTNSDQLAAFSSHGALLDVVAPGEDIFTTIRGHSYAPITGTSAAAPFVSALSALLLSRTPEMSNEMVRAALHNSAVDLGLPDWDRFFGAGRINALAALQLEQVARAEIQSPAMEEGVAANARDLAVRGTVLGAFIEEYELAYGIGTDPTQWRAINIARQQVLDDVLGVWPVQNIGEGAYTLRLLVRQSRGPSVEDKVRVFMDRTPARIRNVRWQDMIDGARHSMLIEFETDDICQTTLWWRAAGTAENFNAVALQYTTTRHRLNFAPPRASEEIEFYLTAINQAGSETREDNQTRNYRLRLESAEVNTLPLVELPIAASLPAGYALSRATDFDRDGSGELVLMRYEANNRLGPLMIFKHTRTGFAPRHTFAQSLYPRDVGDSDGDGKLELLAGFGNRSFVYEAPRVGEFPALLVWADTINFWAARFADLDSDGRNEIIGRIDDVYHVRENEDGSFYTKIAELKNFTRGSNLSGAPHAEIADFDGDGRREILLGDADGDLFIYEGRGNNQFIATWSDSLPLIDSIDYIRAGDFDGDGRMDFAAGCHSNLNLNAEHEFDARHWLFRMYRATSDNRFEVIWEQRFLGVQSPRDFDAGLGAGDLDGDGRDELVLTLFPDAYVVDYENSVARVVWHEQSARSNTAVVAALEQGQAPAFYFSEGERFRAFTSPNNNTGRPAPQNLKALPLDEKTVQLSWNAIAGAQSYALYRAAHDSALSMLATTQSTSYSDEGLISEQVYRYAVATLDSQRGPLSHEVTARPSAAPRVVSAYFLAPHFVGVTFTEPLLATTRATEHFELSGEEAELRSGIPSSVVLSQSGSEVILAFPQVRFAPGRYSIKVREAFDANGVALDTTRATAAFEVRTEFPRFYLTSAKLESAQNILLQFNLAIEATSASDASNYALTVAPSFAAPIALASAQILMSDSTSVRLHVREGAIAPLGRSFVITARNVRSRSGITLAKGEGDALGFAPVNVDLKEVFVYPNPFIAAQHTQLTIAGLTESATITILDEQGRALITLNEQDGDGGYHWDTRNPRGELLPSGVYICFIQTQKEKAWAKFVVVR